ncbi:MAG: protein-tyrosine phosphatase [Arenicella sp.]
MCHQSSVKPTKIALDLWSRNILLYFILNKLMTKQRSPAASNTRVLNIEGVLNFRDIGGYRGADGRQVVWGKVFRSAQLDRLSEQGVCELAALDIKTVVDLRFTDETQKYPTIRSAVPNAEIISWHDEQETDSADKSAAMKLAWRESLDSKDPAKVREAMRINYPKKLYTHRAIYQKMLQRLSEGQTPLLFHCAAGKDRTGVGAALILSLLGVDDQKIIDDYLLTQKELEGRVEAWFAGGATTEENYQEFQEKLTRQSSELLAPIFAADQIYIETLLEYVGSTYGSFVHYAQQKLQLDDAFVERLRVQLLESPGA